MHALCKTQIRILSFLDDHIFKLCIPQKTQNLQVMGGNGSLPSLSELLTKSVAELSEEVITLKLELETEKRCIRACF